MKYIRTKDGTLIDVSLMTECETDDDKGNRVFDGYEDSKGNYYPVENIIKQANTIRELIMKGDLIFYKDSYCGVNATEYRSIAYNDIDKCSQYFEKEITKIFIEDTNGNFIKVSELDDRHNLKIV